MMIGRPPIDRCVLRILTKPNSVSTKNAVKAIKATINNKLMISKYNP